MSEPIAIVGSACRFPGGSNSPSQLWDLLKEPRDVVREFPHDRLNLSKFYNSDGEKHGRTDVQGRSYLLEENPCLFDASFFRINPKEAERMDPQQRILLETVYESLEAAGWPLEAVEGSLTGVYVGCMTSDFNDIQMRDPESFSSYTATGVARSILSNRVSHFFDLRGPSMTIDTACSSSLVALHQAVQAIRTGGATQAIVAGVTLLLDPAMYIAESKLHMLSPDSRSRMWDKGANGYARGEGCAAVILKPLSRALLDNDDIECIIRETGVNSDGRTNGITMPSSTAQEALIRQTYKNAGLDPVKDRCQYFECHGTGTLAGDPVEARAIRDTFFPDEHTSFNATPLYCGSVKTAIGHLEGCAGLAGVLKASLAIQNKTIPPNMHFHQLNPSVLPFCDNLKVPTTPLPWPSTAGRPLRASVNSFGFGGTNAHAIVESYERPLGIRRKSEDGGLLFLFSAKSQSSLLQSLKKMSQYLQVSPFVDMDALSCVLQSRRSAFPIREAISASGKESLLHAIETRIIAAETNAALQLGIHALIANPNKPHIILGIFTGQGAQWAGMGRQLIKYCHIFRKSIEKCEDFLKKVPEPPSWSLMEQLNVDAASSRISEAEFSQPLCTAIQIGLVNVLRAAGVEFGAVIGHSSGEICAAYAYGVLTAQDAIAIAYYRGKVAHLSRGCSGQRGGMLAVGMSYEAATEFSSQPQFSSRINVAASNAPFSVTLAGDLEIIEEAKEILDKNMTFTRLLKVDTAYHSHHMLRCSGIYLKYLERLDIKIQQPRQDCVWLSTVKRYGHILQPTKDQLKGQYWVDNMVHPVMFSQTLDFLLSTQSFAVALEIGPHPSLKGPVNQIYKANTETSVPYSGLLKRFADDITEISNALGMIWSYLGPYYLDFGGWRTACGHLKQSRMLKNLPSYPWDHSRVYWHESRFSQRYRLDNNAPHELLGLLKEATDYDLSWRNLLILKEVPWLRGHRFQDQAIFPAAGYVSMAIQAASSVVKGRHIKLIEIRNLKIAKAMIIKDDSEGVETLFTVHNRTNSSFNSTDVVLETEFACYCCSGDTGMEKVSGGVLIVHVDTPDSGDISPLQMSHAELPPLSVDRFFQAVYELGISYSGIFKAFDSMRRTLGRASANASWSQGQLDQSYLLHPALLDVGFQVGIAAFVSIAQGSMGSTYLPSEIKKIVFKPSTTLHNSSGETAVDIEAYTTHFTNTIVQVDVNLGHGLGNIPNIQVEGLTLKAISQPQAADDRQLFAKTVWDVDASYGFPPPLIKPSCPNEPDYIDAVERTSLFFMQELLREIKPGEIDSFKWHHQQLLKAIPLFLEPVHNDRHTVLKNEWLHDDRETIRMFAERWPNSVDLALLTSVGENWPSVLRGQSEMLEHMVKDDLLGRLYMEGRGFSACNEYAAEFMRTISHKFPRTRILEVGAGTGGTTRSILDSIGSCYSSYTYTDISAGFFEKAEAKFADHVGLMNFQTFNVENDPTEQGFAEGTYDVIIAANVLHATRKLSQTMQNVRSLLRPGGFLIAVEVTGTMLREPGLMGGLEGWWLSTDDGRFPCPGISPKQWDDVLRKTGFSGVESIAYDTTDIERHNCSVFVSQATNDKFDLLRDPLSFIDLLPEARVLIIGGMTLPVSKAVRCAEKLIKRWVPDVAVCNSIEDLDPARCIPGTSVLCLAELDDAIFRGKLTAQKLQNLQGLVATAQNLLWVTSGRLAEDPYSNMMVGIGRALAYEMPHVQMQFLDFQEGSYWDMKLAAQQIARMVLLSSKAFQNHEYLWLHEPEIEAKDGVVLIPRLIQDYEGNRALNASRRIITKIASESDLLELVQTNIGASIRTLEPVAAEQGTVIVDIQLSIPLHMRKEPLYCVCLGTTRRDERTVLALTSVCHSAVAVASNALFEVPSSFRRNPQNLVAVSATLVALDCLKRFSKAGTTIVLDPMPIIAEAIATVARRTNYNVIFATQSTDEVPSDWIHIHPLAPIRNIQRIIPANATSLLSFSNSIGENVTHCLPKSCGIHYFDPNLVARSPIDLSNAYETAITTRSAHVLRVLTLNDMSESRLNSDCLPYVLDWTRGNDLSIVVSPPDPKKKFFADKTYFFAGMAGELGQSLCYYMVNHGARHIVMASRNANDQAKWLSELRSLGANVRALKMDVTNRSQVQATVKMIRQDMPKIGGVGNAALILEDSLFINTTVSGVEKQLKPKIDGTFHLEEQFKEDNLDFFLAFSSIGSVYGNAGQAIYHAANMFVTSLVEKRRRRGLSASVIEVGMISDIGFVAKSERQNSHIEEHLKSQFYAPLSESDFHLLFLRGIHAGRPGSGNGIVTMGIRPFIDDPNATITPPWYSNPYFSHMIHQYSSAKPQVEPAFSIQQLYTKIEQADNMNDAKTLYEELFCQKIESMIKVPATSVDVMAPLSDLGLDSLLAIEIRTWLLKNMRVDVPLLGILSRDSISSICLTAADKAFVAKQDTTVFDVRPKSVILSISTSSGNSTLMDLSMTSLEHDHHEVAGACAAVASSDSGEVLTDINSDSDYIHSDMAAEFNVEARDCPEGKLQTKEVEYIRTGTTSHAQSSMYFLQNYLDDHSAFNVTAQYHIKGHLNVSQFTMALEQTLARHDAYQTCFFSESGSLTVQQGILLKRVEKSLVYLDCASQDKINGAFSLFTNRQWKLATGDTFGAVLLGHSRESHTVIFGCHHIIMDGFSWHIFLHDLDRAYRMLPFKSRDISYLDFAHGQMGNIDSGELNSSIKYWLEHLQHSPSVFPLLPMAKNRMRISQRTYTNCQVKRELSFMLLQSIKDTTQAFRVTPMQLYLAAVQILFTRLLEVDEICIGVAETGRSSVNLEQTIGHFSNLLPMVFRVNHTQSFAEVLQETQRTVLNGFDHGNVPLDAILERLRLSRSAAYSPLFQVAFNYRVGDLLERPLGKCDMKLVRYVDAKTPYDFTFNFTQNSKGGMWVEIASAAYLYSTATTAFIMDTYVSILEEVSKFPNTSILDYKMHDTEKIQNALHLGRGQRIEHTWPKTITEQFGRICQQYPDLPAIRYRNATITYRQLRERINAIGHALCDAGATCGSKVAVFCEPSDDTYASMLAVLQIGGVYIPLDRTLPIARHRAMIEVSQPDFIVTHQLTNDSAQDLLNGGDMIQIDLSGLLTSRDDFKSQFNPAIDAFLLFTSGSTGIPKGIRLSQGGMMNYAASKSKLLRLGHVRVLQQSSTGFDMSIAQAFNAFSNGGTLVIVESIARGDPEAIAKLMADECIDFTICTPSEYMMLITFAADTVKHCTNWTYACSGGEAISDKLIAGLKRLDLPGLILADCFGPTEISCAATCKIVPLDYVGIDNESPCLSVGKTISNSSVHIIDGNGNPLPVGFPGEICITGHGVALGYLDTAQNTKFVPNPFATAEDVSEGHITMYKTGDKGCLDVDGSLLFLGRIEGDTLVKLRGLRIELGEVASAILQAGRGLLTDAVVTVRGDPQFLVAHVVVIPDKDMLARELHDLCSDLPLPRYMIPSIIVKIDRIPVTINGKVDRKSIASMPLPSQLKDNFQKNRLTVAEGELQLLWKDIIGDVAKSTSIEARTDFFMIGGSSLLLVQLQNALRERMGVQIPLQDLYHASTLSKMAIVTTKERSMLPEDIIDWEVETRIPNSILETHHSSKMPPLREQGRQILLTGATGFLGSEILSALVNRDDVVVIHCISVSSAEQSKLPRSEKIVTYTGSLLSSSLGLSQRETIFIQENVDQIIHAGAQGHCLNNYSSIRDANFKSTQILAAIALPRRIPMHFISSGRVILLSGSYASGPISMAAHPPPIDGSQGFTSSKWASEYFLERLSSTTGLPVAIHRPCSLIGSRAPHDDAMNSIIRYSLLSGMVPSVPQAEGFFDFKDVVVVATEIVGGPIAKGPISFRHHSSGVRLPFSQLAQRMSALYTGEFREVSMDYWIQIASKLGIEGLIISYLEANIANGSKLVFPYLGDVA